MGFWHAVLDHSFLRMALAAGVLASVACGVIGSYVSARRLTYIAGGIAHCVLGGLGAARYLHEVWGWEQLHPLHGAIVAALLAAAIIGVVGIRARGSEDTVISAVWAIGMAVGILFIWRTPGYNEDLMSYLFGNILMVGPDDLWLIAALDAIVLAVGLGCYRQLLAVCFDSEFAQVRGLHVQMYYLLLLCLTALTVVLLVTVVGLVMVIALLSLPTAAARRLVASLWQVMWVSAGISAVCTIVGLVISYDADVPAGATTIMLAGAAYIVVSVGAAIRTRWHQAIAPPTEQQ